MIRGRRAFGSAAPLSAHVECFLVFFRAAFIPARSDGWPSITFLDNRALGGGPGRTSVGIAAADRLARSRAAGIV